MRPNPAFHRICATSRAGPVNSDVRPLKAGSPMLRFLIIFLIGAAIIAGVFYAFYLHVGIGLPLSSTASDWGIFGDYFGGVSSAFLSFISILLIVYTIDQQSRQIEHARQEAIKRDLLQNVSKADDEIDTWLRKRLAAQQGDKDVEFGDIVWGIVAPSYANSEEFSAAVVRLHKLTCTYCVTLGLYKDNIDTYFIFQQHRQKADELIAFLEKHHEHLSNMAGPSLGFCKLHIHGKSEA